MAQRFLVTGGAGFIGSHLCERLLERGEVVCVDNLLTGSRDKIASLEGKAGFTFVQSDVCDGIEVRPPVSGVFHLASLASPVHYMRHPIATLRVGSEGTRHALDIARRDGARFLLSSTSEVYGDPKEHPQRESYWGHVNPVGPRSCYDESKRYAEALTVSYRGLGVDTRIARIFNTYGPRMSLDDGRVVPAFVKQALNGEPLTVFGDGSQTRSFCYVDDLVAGLLALYDRGDDQPVNLGNPVEMTILQFAEAVQKALGSSSPIQRLPLPKDDPTRRRPDISRAKSLLGWEPKVPLGEGLVATIAYFRPRARGLKQGQG
jgi:dTDP-glucose 4,6-dehydratase